MVTTFPSLLIVPHDARCCARGCRPILWHPVAPRRGRRSRPRRAVTPAGPVRPTATASVHRAKRPVSGRWRPTGCDDAQVGAEPTECVPEQPARGRVRRWWAWAPLFGLGLGVLAGAALRIAGRPGAADLIWAAVTVAALLPAAWSMLRALWHRHFGVDVIARAGPGRRARPSGSTSPAR